MNHRIISVFIIIIIKVTAIVLGLRITHLRVPQAVENGKNATLSCEIDVENEVLYQLKWYRGRKEFYRYTPKEMPAVKIFPLTGIHINVQRTNLTHLTLINVDMKTGGKYSCEISADSPSFQTDIKSASLLVAFLPSRMPLIIGLKSCYQIGDMLKVNCTSKNSLPVATLEWKINNHPVYSTDILKYKPEVNSSTNLRSVTIGLNFLISALFFQKKKIMIHCIAQIYDLYFEESSETLEIGQCSRDLPSLSYLSDDDFNSHKKGTAARAIHLNNSVRFFITFTMSIILNQQSFNFR